jgi:hypothetical protein
MDTQQKINVTGVLVYELSLADKITLGVFGILDALLNCSLDSFNAIFSRELRGTVVDEPIAPPPVNPELRRLRAMRTQLDRSAAKVESMTITVVTQKIPLQERLKARTRRQALYSWRPAITPSAKQ